MAYSWYPKLENYQTTPLFKLIKKLNLETVEALRLWTINNKEKFWDLTIKELDIVFKKPYTQVFNFEPSNSRTQWLLNSSFNIVDSCFRNSPDSIAIYQTDETGHHIKLTQKELDLNVNKLANGINEKGLTKGDVLAIVMPMNIQAVQLYLAAIKAGLKVVTVADSFSKEEITNRLNIAKPKMICTQDVFLRNGKNHKLSDKVSVVSGCLKVVHFIKSKSTAQNEINYSELFSNNDSYESVACEADSITTILFSSGTTGNPKAIPWTHTTPIKAASDAMYHHAIQEGDVVCWPTNLGWMMGPWLIFATFLNKGSIALFNGAPTTKTFVDFVEETKVTLLGLVPTLVKHWRTKNLLNENVWSKIQRFSSTGEVSNAEDMSFLMQISGGKPILEYCGGTEIGGGYISSTLMEENKPSKFSGPTLGTSFVVLDENMQKADKGAVYLKPPILGLSESLINANHYDVYFKDAPIYEGESLRVHGDCLEKTNDGYYLVRGRLDDTMNLGGIKVSAVQIEKVVNELDFIQESAAIAYVPDKGGADHLVLFYVGDSGTKEEKIVEVQNQIKNKLNPLFKVFDLIKIDKLPRTASNKVMRKLLKQSYTKTHQ